jgi:hypothetical protein
MKALGTFLSWLETRKLMEGRVRGLFHILVGREIVDKRGDVISNGLTWREVAEAFAAAHINTAHVEQLGLDPEKLAPRDRKRFWYAAIMTAKPDSLEAREEAEKLIAALKPHGYQIGDAPPPSKPSLSSPPEASAPKEETEDEGDTPKKPKTKKKK